MKKSTIVRISVGVALMAVAAVLLYGRLSDQAEPATAQEDPAEDVAKSQLSDAEAQAAIDQADSLLNSLRTQGASTGLLDVEEADEFQETLEDFLQEAASDLDKAKRRLEAGDAESALDDAEEALEELAEAEQLLGGSR